MSAAVYTKTVTVTTCSKCGRSSFNTYEGRTVRRSTPVAYGQVKLAENADRPECIPGRIYGAAKTAQEK